MTDTKLCGRCKSEKDIADFSPSFAKRNGTWCRPCVRAYYKIHRHSNVFGNASYRKAFKKNNLTRKCKRLGISADEFTRLYKLQDGKCALCEIDQGECIKRFAIDHDHATGIVRGLLCDKCNRGIGLLNDSPSILIKAAEYVQRGYIG